MNVVNAGDETLTGNITSIHLSGSLGKSIAVHSRLIKGVILKKAFEIHGELNPGRVENVLKGLFQE